MIYEFCILRRGLQQFRYHKANKFLYVISMSTQTSITDYWLMHIFIAHMFYEWTPNILFSLEDNCSIQIVLGLFSMFLGKCRHHIIFSGCYRGSGGSFRKIFCSFCFSEICPSLYIDMQDFSPSIFDNLVIHSIYILCVTLLTSWIYKGLCSLDGYST